MFKPVGYVRPGSIEETVDLLAKEPGRCRLIAGGTDLLVQKPAETEVLVDVAGLGLREMAPVEGHLRIGSAVTVAELEEAEALLSHPCLTVLAEAAALLGTPGVRNRATIGGNLCNGSPAADLAVAALALDAEVGIAGPQGVRKMPVADFFRGVNRTALRPGEIVTAVEIPLGSAAAMGAAACAAADGPAAGAPEDGVAGRRAAAAFLKLRRHQSSVDIATVNVAAVVNMDEDVIADARVALGAVGETPLLSAGAAAAVAGREPSDEVFRAAGAAAAAEARPISDIRASAEYRREMTAVLVRRVLEEAVRRCRA